jgi:prevent-host-death family protein
MKVISAGKAKNGFGSLIDTARVEPVTIAKHGRPVAVVLSVEKYDRLRAGAMLALELAGHGATREQEVSA